MQISILGWIILSLLVLFIVIMAAGTLAAYLQKKDILQMKKIYCEHGHHDFTGGFASHCPFCGLYEKDFVPEDAR